MTVKKGYSWSDQLGIAIASLVEAGQEELVNWTRDVCVSSDGLRQLEFISGVDFDIGRCSKTENYRTDGQ